MSQRFCPECGGALFYEAPVQRFICKSCGLYVDREELYDLKVKRTGDVDEKTRKKREHGEYLEWWLASKQTKSKA